MYRRVILTVAAAALTVLAATAGTVAWADASSTASSTLTLGPVPISNVALKVCVGATCETSPPVTSIGATLTIAKASPTATGAAGTIVAKSCSTGTGIAAAISGGTSPSVLTGSVTLDVGGGRTVLLPVHRALPANAPTTVVSACTG